MRNIFKDTNKKQKTPVNHEDDIQLGSTNEKNLFREARSTSLVRSNSLNSLKDPTKKKLASDSKLFIIKLFSRRMRIQ